MKPISALSHPGHSTGNVEPPITSSKNQFRWVREGGGPNNRQFRCPCFTPSASRPARGRAIHPPCRAFSLDHGSRGRSPYRDLVGRRSAKPTSILVRHEPTERCWQIRMRLHPHCPRHDIRESQGLITARREPRPTGIFGIIDKPLFSNDLWRSWELNGKPEVDQFNQKVDEFSGKVVNFAGEVVKFSAKVVSFL